MWLERAERGHALTKYIPNILLWILPVLCWVGVAIWWAEPEGGGEQSPPLFPPGGGGSRPPAPAGRDLEAAVSFFFMFWTDRERNELWLGFTCSSPVYNCISVLYKSNSPAYELGFVQTASLGSLVNVNMTFLSKWVLGYFWSQFERIFLDLVLEKA